MTRKRPTAVLVIAIFHFILAGCCGIAGIFTLAGGQEAIGKLQAGANRGEKEFQDKLQQAIEKRLPSFKTLEKVESGSLVLLSVLLVIAAVGLLNMQPWGRVLSLVYAILGILRAVADGIFGFAVVVPVLREAIKDIPGAPPEAVQMGGAFGAAGIGINICGNLIYPIVVLIVMLLPGVAAAFRAPASGYPSEVRDEGDDDQYDRGERWGPP